MLIINLLIDCFCFVLFVSKINQSLCCLGIIAMECFLFFQVKNKRNKLAMQKSSFIQSQSFCSDQLLSHRVLSEINLATKIFLDTTSFFV